MDYLFFAIIFLLIALVVLFVWVIQHDKKIETLIEEMKRFRGKAFLSVPLPKEKGDGVEFLFLQEAKVETKPPAPPDLSINVHDSINMKEKMGGAK